MDGRHRPTCSSEHLPSQPGFCSDVAVGGCPLVPTTVKWSLGVLAAIPTAAAVMLSIRSMIENRRKKPITCRIATGAKQNSIDQLANKSRKPGGGSWAMDTPARRQEGRPTQARTARGDKQVPKRHLAPLSWLSSHFPTHLPYS